MIKIGNMIIPGGQNIKVNNPAQFYGQGHQQVITWIASHLAAVILMYYGYVKSLLKKEKKL